MSYVRKTYGLFESVGKAFDAFGATMATVSNVASSADAFTNRLPELGDKAGTLMHDRMDTALNDQRRLLKQAEAS